MKLISLITLLATVRSQKNQQEQFSFTPQFQTPSSILFSSDSSIYLPPESHTPIPYYALNNINKLPLQFLPPTGTKTPIFSTSFPLLLSSTLKSDTDEEDNENEHEEDNNYRSVIIKSPLQKHLNHTSAARQAFDKREAKLNTRVPNIQMSSENFKMKSPNYVASTKSPMQNQPLRRMIITSELQRSDAGIDQAKASSFQNTQFIQAPGIFVSSTTEPSIPILRLSNEMDLDGSFSYEALGADQTHYVQHSRMENMGTDKEEQVVEGSYSYVGDDGRTYTVHYVADSNGYRATGDHLPVPPPIPEIIQRSVQYNLAEEARQPPHSKSSWENENSEYENLEETKQRLFSIPPPRKLFTGKTPEAFSFGFSQGINSQNNLATAASYQIPTKTSFDIAMDHAKSKLNVTPISPQITFLASQGARNPSLQPQSSPTKTNVDKSSLPLLINYEADIKQPEQEANKALWRWQYGLNTNSNQIPNKNSISRSFSEGDDVVINFSDMTPEQYTSMIQSQVLSQNIQETNNIDINNGQSSTPNNLYLTQSSTPNNLNMYLANNKPKSDQINLSTEKYKFIESSEESDFFLKEADKKQNTDVYSKIISSHNFIPRSQVATQSYNVEITPFEPTQINVLNDNSNINHNVKIGYSNNQYILPDDLQERTTSVEPMFDNLNNKKQTEFKLDDKDSFKPIAYNRDGELFKYESTTTEPPIEEKIKENIFLKSLFNNDKNVSNKNMHEGHKHTNISETKMDKIPKYIQFQQKPQNEIKMMQSKPLDMNDVLNYVIMKNHFESVKTKPKNKPTNNIQHSQLKDTFHYIPVKDTNEDRENKRQEKDNDYHVLNSQQQQELRGLIKNYKVLQRSKNTGLKSQPISEPQRHIKAFHTPGLPPLGRAGPSMKSYLPPTLL